jgi:UPF0176 protein
MRILNLAAYRFAALDDLSSLRERLFALADERDLLGTILLAVEGINLFLAGETVDVRAFRAALESDPRFAGLEAKESWSDFRPFNRLVVKIKREIVTMGRPDVRSGDNPAPRVSAVELKRWLDEDRELVLLDTRNTFEFERGTFDGAVHLGNDNFRAFPQLAQAQAEQWRNTPVVTFCTGGIRCEKAAPFLAQLGCAVYQLDGGILRYFEEAGGKHFRGECFVFDQRVALDSALAPADAAVISRA